MNETDTPLNLFGAPVFSPERLTTARQRRKMTMKALAELVGTNAMTVTRFERGESHPEFEMVESLSSALAMPAAFLYGNASDSIEVEAVSFRARRAMTATVRDKTLATGSIASVTLSPEFHRRFTMPALDLPDLAEYKTNPSAAARILRNHWKLSVQPIQNMIKLLESVGVEVYWIAEDSPSVDAVSFWRDRRPFLIMNSVDKAGERCRFNAAHELGHMVLHRHEVVKEGAEIEKQADAFASCFLLASEQFYYECPRNLALSNFFPLKKRWGVSIQAMVRRGKDLGVFREYQYERAFKEISSLGWRKKEPHELRCEESTLHRLLYESLHGDGITPAQFAKMVNLNLDLDMLEMTPIAHDYLNAESRRAYISRMVENENPNENPRKGTVTKFPRPSALPAVQRFDISKFRK